MATTIIMFPDRRLGAHKPSSRRQDNHPARRDEGISDSSKSISQTQAHRIVEQIEREIANRAYERAQRRFQTPATLHEMQPPSGVAGRILLAIRALAQAI